MMITIDNGYDTGRIFATGAESETRESVKMRIMACIKQVPATTTIDMDPESGVLKREGIAAKMNPYDLYALEAALRIRDAAGGDSQVTALTMGPPQAEAVVREALYMGADQAFLLCDRRFAGADVLATSYTLCQGVWKLGPFDLIVCGRQTTDGDTAQVGAELAEWLDWPHAAYVSDIIAVGQKDICVQVQLEAVVQTQRISLPCLIAVDKDIFTPRLPSYRRQLALQNQPIGRITCDDLNDNDESHYGLAGSPTQVERIFPPEHEVIHRVHQGSGDELAQALYELLAGEKFV